MNKLLIFNHNGEYEYVKLAEKCKEEFEDETGLKIIEIRTNQPATIYLFNNDTNEIFQLNVKTVAEIKKIVINKLKLKEHFAIPPPTQPVQPQSTLDKYMGYLIVCAFLIIFCSAFSLILFGPGYSGHPGYGYHGYQPAPGLSLRLF